MAAATLQPRADTADGEGMSFGAMPTYEYRCADDHISELRQRMSDPTPTSIECHCGAPAARVWSAPAAIHFKGRGFYSTDVRGRQERRRRPNAGDDLYRDHDVDAAAIARSL